MKCLDERINLLRFLLVLIVDLPNEHFAISLTIPPGFGRNEEQKK